MILDSTGTTAASPASAMFAVRPATASVRGLGGADDSFEQTLAHARRADEITAAARSLTAQALVAPILKELRSNSIAWGPFGAGDAEKTFGPMLDLKLADRIAASPRLPVAAAIEARLRARERDPG